MFSPAIEGDCDVANNASSSDAVDTNSEESVQEEKLWLRQLCYAPRELICAELAKKDVLARERDIAEVGRAKSC